MRAIYAVAALLTLGTPACKESASSSAARSEGAAPMTRRADKAASAQPYSIDVAGPPPAAVGQTVSARVTVRPRAPYKVNLEYPLKMTVSAPAGAKLVKSELAAADARELSKDLIRIEPAFSLNHAGAQRFDAELRFSVCTAALCELKREKVRWTAQAR